MFQSDGAGCFRDKQHRVLMPFWKIWTGVNEVQFKLSPAGAGKTNLDGAFARVNTCLKTAADQGTGFTNAAELLVAISKSNGMSATQFYGFTPDRDPNHALSAAIQDASIESVLRSEYNPIDLSITTFKHSGYGSGQIIPREKMHIFNQKTAPTLKKRGDPPGALPYTTTIMFDTVREFLGDDGSVDDDTLVDFFRRANIPRIALCAPELMRLKPKCENIIGGVIHDKRLPACTTNRERDRDTTDRCRLRRKIVLRPK